MKFLEALEKLDNKDADVSDLFQGYEGTAMRVRPGKVIYHAQDPSDSVYLLLEGMVRGYVGSETTTRTTLMLRGPAVFGDRDLQVNGFTQETVETLGEVRLLMWDKDEFLAEHEKETRLRSWLWRDLACRYTSAVNLVGWQTGNLRDRLLTLLYQLHSNNETLPSYDQLGAIAGATRRAVARELRLLREEGTINIAENKEAFSVNKEKAEDLGLGELPPLFHSLISGRSSQSSVL